MKVLFLALLFISTSAIALSPIARRDNIRRVIKTISMTGRTTGKWTEFSKDPALNVKNLINKLEQSQFGKRLIKKAALKAGEQGKTIFEVIKEGRGSLTDTTLIRRFSASNPNSIEYETKSIVYINDDLGYFDATLDLAHELTHFVYRKNFNPYQLNFNMEEFIKNTIESYGGEAHAFVNECKVLQELYPSKLKYRNNCLLIYNELDGSFSLTSASREFYRMGDHYDTFLQKVNKHELVGKFPHASSERAAFISSAYGLPYPIAAYQEYMGVIKKVCQNDKKRLIYMLKEKDGRTPASQISEAQVKYNKMCKSIL